jgi:hypothetical protein
LAQTHIDTYALQRDNERRRKDRRKQSTNKSAGVCVSVSDAFVQELLIQARPSATQKGENWKKMLNSESVEWKKGRKTEGRASHSSRRY